MEIRNWQQKIIDDFPSIVKDNRRFILKAPTGAGKTYLASELIKRFYNKKKVIVLCHRLVLLEQLEKALQKEHKIRKLAVSETSIAFDGYDILLSTNMRAKEIIAEAIPMADLVIVDEAHRISPNGRGYKAIIDNFRENSKDSARFMGLTASPERRTGDQRDQLHLAFDTIIDCADIQNLIDENDFEDYIDETFGLPGYFPNKKFLDVVTDLLTDYKYFKEFTDSDIYHIWIS